MKWWDRMKQKLERPWAAYTFALCTAVILFLFLSNLSFFGGVLRGIGSIFAPVFIGLVIAYVIDPLVTFWEIHPFRKIKRRTLKRGLSVAVTWVLLIVFLVILGFALVPQLISSVRMFISNLGGYANALNVSLRQLQEYAASHNVDISNFTSSAGEMLGTVTNSLPQNVNGILNTTIEYGADLVNGVISCFIAIYISMDKERLLSGFGRLFHALTNEKGYQKASHFLGRCNGIMAQYILVDILDGIIIACANAIFMLIVGYPYVPLISTVVGVTNLAPTFGPIVGAVIGAFILFLVNPWYALGFLIFTIVLQTIDGYVLKPKLFGGQLGVPSIWILISIIVFGRMLGVVGILIAIPIAAIIDFIYREEILVRLESRREMREKEQKREARRKRQEEQSHEAAQKCEEIQTPEEKIDIKENDSNQSSHVRKNNSAKTGRSAKRSRDVK